MTNEGKEQIPVAILKVDLVESTALNEGEECVSWGCGPLHDAREMASYHTQEVD